MSCLGRNYLPNPPRTWSRTEKVESVMPVKQNVLQYRGGNTMSKKQMFAQIAKGMWLNNKSYATQTETYTNNNINNFESITATKINSSGQQVPSDTPLSKCSSNAPPPPPPAAIPVPPPQSTTSAAQTIPPPTTTPEDQKKPTDVPLSEGGGGSSSSQQTIISENTVLALGVITNPCTGELLKSCLESSGIYFLSASGIKCSGVRTIRYFKRLPY